MKIAILTSPNQWFIPYAKKLNQLIKNSELFLNHKEIFNFDIVFILSYHQIIDKKFLKQNKHNIVIHASNLPQGKGWAPLFHQIIEGKNEITFSLFEANEKADNGDIYLQKNLKLNGLELYEELREKQATFTLDTCLEFLKLYPNIKAKKQKGQESFYPKRNPKNSELDINKSLKEQFNLLRIVSNEEFPAFFYKDSKKFILKIYSNNINSKASILTLQNYIYLSKKIKEKLRFYRNHPQVKKYLYTTHYISKQEHKKFIQKLKKNSKKSYFCVSCDNQILGSINFEKISNNTATFGFFGNPYTTNIGTGFTLEFIAVFYCFYIMNCKYIHIEVMKDNKSVLLLHKKFGFKKIDDSDKIIKLELCNNNHTFNPFSPS
ncbi:UDP-4-amino-4,6-dideoxy-N-acetyl-beta-L-altrosamine N-acetyltransferase [Campylobacter jejuni]|uniref:UDP-4-amino-4, 6-dideoxy-N-acetyl-beta-L-altrosamine N-acetyltransferase n=1 Tax=Campylobacter jejuni TaxID=197 RepID=UPI001553773E|nr:UDP-4-amino-4,6-dideoxy-N-acetyl-beta-L-altrosamine N-acetyltransferase [Campylobacter jejuni]